MEPTLYPEWVARFFPGIVLRITQTYNDKATPGRYLYRRFLRPEFSIDGRWETLNANNVLVAADVIAMDSSIPLKLRPSLGRASGEIPKMGMELALREKQLTDIATLISKKLPDAVIIAKIFSDTPTVIGGVYERIEQIFLEGLSSGITVIDDTENVGTGIRVDYKYRAENKFASSVSWDDTANAKPFTDMKRVRQKAINDGNAITTVMLDSNTFDYIAASQEARVLFAASAGISVANVALIPIPDIDQVNSFTRKRFGWVFEIVDRTIKVQRNGTNTNITPWKAGSVIFLTSENIGTLAYARLAEQDSPVAGVTYQTTDNFILVSKFRLNRPSLAEITNSQARVIPVLDGVDSIYLLDSTQDNG